MIQEYNIPEVWTFLEKSYTLLTIGCSCEMVILTTTINLINLENNDEKLEQNFDTCKPFAV